jgi:hypothetical protein
MDSLNGDKSELGEATPEKLAGISVRVEAEEDLTVRQNRPPQTLGGADANGTGHPTINQLAGIYVEIEAAEDLTVRPQRSPENSLPIG